MRDDLEKDASKRRYDAETRAIVESNRDRRMHRKMRLSYANKVFCYLAWYSVFVGILLVVLGVSGGTWFKLPDLVVTTLVGSTAAAAIGLVGFVVSGLFKDLR